MYSDIEINAKRALAAAAKLSGAQLLDDTAAVRRECNGIGAEYFPSWVRALLGRLLPGLVVAADIHDLRYARGGDEYDREAADREFHSNGIRLARHLYRWYDPRRALAIRRANQCALALRWGGSGAFNYHYAAADEDAAEKINRSRCDE